MPNEQGLQTVSRLPPFTAIPVAMQPMPKGRPQMTHLGCHFSVHWAWVGGTCHSHCFVFILPFLCFVLRFSRVQYCVHPPPWFQPEPLRSEFAPATVRSAPGIRGPAAGPDPDGDDAATGVRPRLPLVLHPGPTLLIPVGVATPLLSSLQPRHKQRHHTHGQFDPPEPPRAWFCGGSGGSWRVTLPQLGR